MISLHILAESETITQGFLTEGSVKALFMLIAAAAIFISVLFEIYSHKIARWFKNLLNGKEKLKQEILALKEMNAELKAKLTVLQENQVALKVECASPKIVVAKILLGLWRNQKPIHDHNDPLTAVLTILGPIENFATLLINQEYYDVDFVAPAGNDFVIAIRCHGTDNEASHGVATLRRVGNDLLIDAQMKDRDPLHIFFGRPEK